MTEQFPNGSAAEIHAIGSKLEKLAETLTTHDIRLAVLEQNQAMFQDAIIKRLDHRETHQRELYQGLRDLQTELSTLPERVSAKVTACRQEIDADLRELQQRNDERYASKLDVLTPASLRNILLIVTTSAAALFAGIRYVGDTLMTHDQSATQARKHLEDQIKENKDILKEWRELHPHQLEREQP